MKIKDWIGKSIENKILVIVVIILSFSMFAIALASIYTVDSFSQFTINRNTENIKQQALYLISNATREQAARHDIFFRNYKSLSKLLVKQTEIYLRKENQIVEKNTANFRNYEKTFSDTFYIDSDHKITDDNEANIILNAILKAKPLVAEIFNNANSIEAIWMKFQPSLNYIFGEKHILKNILDLENYFSKKSNYFEIFTKDENENKNEICLESLHDVNYNFSSIITVLSPIYSEENNITGMLGIDISIDNIFDELLFSSQLEINKKQGTEFLPKKFKNEFSFLVNHNGEIVALPYEFLNLLGIELDHSNINFEKKYNLLETKNSEFKKIAEKIVQCKNDFIKFSSKDKYYYASFYPIKSMGWSICRIVPEKDIFSSIIETQSAIAKTLKNIIINFLILTILFWILSIIVFKLFLRKNLHKPLKTITNSFKIIAQGNLEHRIKLKLKDEIGNIANSFNSMTHELYLSRKELNEHKENLEEIVEGRTNELIESNLKLVEEINERKETEQKLKKAKQSAEEANNLKTTFLSNMSHEIRTPMNSIIGFSRMLSVTELDEEDKKKFIELIIENGMSLLKIVNDILEASKIEAGLVGLNFINCNVSKILNELYTSFKVNKRFLKDNIEFVNQVKGDDIVTYTDCQRLRQVIIKLIENAFKFTISGYVEIGCYIKSNDVDDEKVVIYIKDSGLGISDDKIKFIFDRFRQGDDSRTRGFGGTGLGLSISNKLVKLLGGEINVLSKINKGSIFTVEIPYKQKNNNESSEIELEKSWDNKSIIIADDVKSNYDYIFEILRPTNANMYWAKNGDECIKLFKKNKNTDLILMDIQMPIINGLDATKFIKEINPKIPVIAQTAYALSNDITEIVKAGCDDYIIKPISRIDLILIINKYFN